jgi:translocator protein
MTLVLLGLFFSLIAVACYALVLIHAVRRSIGTAFMVLCIPFYNLYYGFSQFEHRRKGLILAGWLGGLVMGIMLRVASLRLTGGT